jgi:ribonuclease VapC
VIVDSSAIVAILLGEDEADTLIETLGTAEAPRMSAFSYLEVGTVLMNRRGPAGRRALDALIDTAGIAIAPFDQQQAIAALDALARYGKGRHKAALNIGDAASYALSRTTGKPLLYKGDDFTHTDVERA